MRNCCFNHPAQIICPFVNLDCTSNQIVNPQLPNNFAYFTNPSPGTIGAGQNIALTGANFFGNNFLPNGLGGIVLSAGTYEINYFAGAVVSAEGSVSVGLSFNGSQVVDSNTLVSQAVGDNVTLNRTLVLTVAASGSLYLVNTTGESVDFTFASLFIRQL